MKIFLKGSASVGLVLLVGLGFLQEGVWGFAATADVVKPDSTSLLSTKKLSTKEVVTRVVVTGATGRTGSLVVEELLARGVSNVVALVRDEEKFAQVFPNPAPNLECVRCDLGNPEDIEKAVEGADAAIWCATGFSDNPDTNWVEKIKGVLGLAVKGSKKSIDAVGLPALANSFASSSDYDGVQLPKVVMCSSAGVTRPTWSEEKKEKFEGAADIPIVRLNPFQILDRKRESEVAVRKTTNYCIVRPCGLNDDWPAGSRPLFSQGDVAVGRINRKDVANILVDVLSTPEATGKTFEVIAVAGYPKPTSLGPALDRLYKDGEATTGSEEALFATYTMMQQLLPGEKQNSAALAMGQSYESFDKDQPGRFGNRGEENLESAFPKNSS